MHNSVRHASKSRAYERSALAHAGILRLLCGRWLVFMLRGPHAAHRVIGASTEIDVEVVHIAGDVRIVAERRHDVILRRGDVLATARDHPEDCLLYTSDAADE